MRIKKGTKYLSIIIPAFLFIINSCALSPGNGENNGSTSGEGKSSLGIPPSYAEYFVAANGSDANPGTKEFPFLSIQKALDSAPNSAAVIYVGSGLYVRGAGLRGDGTNGIMISNKNNIMVLGGWNGDFSAQTGESVLDGTNGIFHIISISDSTGITIEGFIIKDNLYTNYMNGGGISILYSSLCVLSNCVIMSNQVSWYGGGIYISHGSLITLNCELYDNRGLYGAGVYIYGSGNTINCIMKNNNASQFGGGLDLCGNSNTVRGIYISNTASSNGGGIMIGGDYLGITYDYGHYNDIDCLLLNNTAVYGGGMFLHGNHNKIAGSILSNTAGSESLFSSGYGGGLYLSGNYNTITGIAAGNFARNDGGGLCIYYGTHNKIDASICSNTAENGGGLYLYGPESTANYSIIEGTFAGNSASTSGGFGGGIFLSADYCIIRAVINSNQASYGGGIYLWEQLNSYGYYNTLFCSIVQNSSYYGGGIDGGGYYNLIDCTLVSNSSLYQGGGISFNGSQSEIKGLILNNSSSNGGGIYLEGDLFYDGNNTVSADIISNSALIGGGIYLLDSGANCAMITNSRLLYNSAANGVIYLGSGYNFNSLISCTVGGDGRGYALYEGAEDNTWKTISGNIFLTNTLEYLYHDFADGDIGLDDINALNTPGDIRHDAVTAGGNSVSNE